jgi:hypothetical protein
VIAAERIALLQEQALQKPCGSRAKYVSGCRCEACRAANRAYSRFMRMGKNDNYVDPAPVRRHLEKLSRAGVGKRTVAEVAKVPPTTISLIKRGEKTLMKRSTAERILAVSPKLEIEARGDRALINGAETWRLLDELVSRGYTKGSLARWLGFVRPAVQFPRDRVTVRTAVRVRKLYDDLNAGRIRREA